MLAKSPSKRPSIAEIYNSRWLSEINDFGPVPFALALDEPDSSTAVHRLSTSLDGGTVASATTGTSLVPRWSRSSFQSPPSLTLAAEMKVPRLSPDVIPHKPACLVNSICAQTSKAWLAYIRVPFWRHVRLLIWRDSHTVRACQSTPIMRSNGWFFPLRTPALPLACLTGTHFSMTSHQLRMAFTYARVVDLASLGPCFLLVSCLIGHLHYRPIASGAILPLPRSIIA